MRILVSLLFVFLSLKGFAQERHLDLARKAQSIAVELEQVQDQLTRDERRLVNRNLNRIEDILGIWGDADSSQVFCKHTGSGWYRLVNLDTNKEIDTSGTNQSQCEMRTKPVMGRVCKHTGSGWYRITKVDGQELDSSGTNYATCDQRLKANHQSQFSCKHTGSGWYRLVDHNGKEMDSSGTNLDSCTDRLPHFRSRMFCKHTGSGWYRLTTIDGNEMDTSGSNLSNCKSRVQ